MSYAAEVKKQLCTVDSDCTHCRAAELAGIIEFSGHAKSGVLRCTTENSDIAARMEADFRLADMEPLTEKSGKVYHLSIFAGEPLDTLAARLRLFAATDLFFDALPSDCCISSFIRGCFLGSGSVTDPRKSYHIEFDTKYRRAAEHLYTALTKLNCRVKMTHRKDGYVVYAKESEAVAAILAVMGAGVGVMTLYNIQIEKEMRNAVNRQVNCETANVDKIVKAAVHQMDAITKIECANGLDSLPDKLKEAALLRKQYPDESLKELAARLGIGKSGMNHRFARIIAIAEEL